MSQQWNYDSLSRLVNRQTEKCLDAGENGNLYDKVFLWDCDDEPRQKWERNIQYKYFSKEYRKYLGVAYCGDTSESKWLELRNLDTDEKCNATQTWF